MLTVEQLSILMNSWVEGTNGHVNDVGVLKTLDEIGGQIGYGALAQYAQWLYEAQCHGSTENAAHMKRSRFNALGWKLPEKFEEIANGNHRTTDRA